MGLWAYTDSIVFSMLILLAFSASSPAQESEEASLPEGNTGIAAKYPGDRGIEENPGVIFVERFDEDSLEALFERWDSCKGKDIMSFSPDTPDGSVDGVSLLMTHTGGEDTGGHLYRRLLPGHKQIFARFYVKFDPGCAPIHHFGTHLGGFNPPTPWPQGGAGTRTRRSRRGQRTARPEATHTAASTFTA